MKKKLLFLALGFFNTFFAEACTLYERTSSRPNRIYLGPEFFAFHVDTHIQDTKIDGTRYFWGLRFGYEYISPNHFYGAAELFATNAAHNFSTSNPRRFYQGRGGAGFGSIQTRFGYTGSARGHLFTPYLGLSVIALSQHGHNGFKEDFGCLTGGLRSLFNCGNLCAIGLNMELFRTLGLHEKVTLKSETASNRANNWGCNVAAPLIFYISAGWDLQITPSYTRLLFSQSQNLYGLNLLFGYRF